MILHGGAQRRGVEPAAPEAARGEQRVTEQLAERAAEPGRERHRESDFRAGHDFRRQQPPGEALEQHLASESTNLVLRPQAHRPLDQRQVQERHPGFHRGRHAHLIHLHEQVIGQPEPHVDVEHPVERRARPGVGEGALERLHGGWRVGAKRLRDKPIALAAREAREPGREPLGLVAEPRRAADDLEPPERERQPVEDPIEQRAAHRPRQPGEPPRPRLDRVLGIAREQLVATFAGEHHGHRLAREPRHHVRRDRGGLAHRLVLVPDEARQLAQQVRGAHRELAVLGAAVRRDAARERQLAVGPGCVEADRERLDGAGAHAAHERHDEARIDAAREQRAERHLAHETHAYRLGEAGLQLGERLVIVELGLGLVGDAPEPASLGT